jgi:hypothetical protein
VVNIAEDVNTGLDVFLPSFDSSITISLVAISKEIESRSGLYLF